MKKSIVMRLINSYIKMGKPFVIILCNGNQSQPLRFLEEDAECLIVESVLDGAPAAYTYDEIKSLTPYFQPLDSHSLKTAVGESLPSNNISAAPDQKSVFTEYWQKEYEKAKQVITCEKFVLIDRRDTVKSRIKHTEIAKDWVRIDSMFNDAKKNHSLEQKADNIIFELDSLTPCTEVNISLGMVFAALKEYDMAAEEYYNGGDYHNAAYCAMQNGDEIKALYYLKCLIKSDKPHDGSELPAFFFLCSKYKDADFCVANFNNPDASDAEVVFYGLLTLYKMYDSDFSKLGTAKNEYLSDILIILSKLKNTALNGNGDDIILTSYISVSELDGKSNNQTSAEIDGAITGEIYSFYLFENNGYGFIRTREDKALYYNICQVEDSRLRALLWDGLVDNAKVSLTLGIGKNGNKAADHIRWLEDISDENIFGANKVYGGMLDSFGEYDKYGNRYGIISSDKDIIFREEAVIDPVLKAYFDNTFSIKNIYVKCIRKKTKRNYVALKMWLDNDKEEKLFNEYYSYVPKEKYDKFVKKRDEIEHRTSVNPNCPYAYSALPVWYDNTETLQPDKTAEYEEKSTIQKPLERNYMSHLGINELLANGTHYLTVVKDLKKAEAYFLTVLERKPEKSHINTAVSNLIAIYHQENRTDDALDILQKYRKEMERDKYNNQLIQIYDKSKQYNELIGVLKEVIPYAGKAKSHRIRQLITCYLKTNHAKEAIGELKKYRRSIDDLSYNNLYSSALEIQGDYAELETFLKRVIESTYRVEHKLNYMNRLALFYQKNSKIPEAINIYEQWKKYYNSNRSGITMSTTIAAISKLETGVDRNLCTLYYRSDRIEEAKFIAGNLLRKNSEDTIAQQILDGTYRVSNDEQTEITDSGNEYMDFEGIDDSVPKLLEWMMNNVDYERYLYNASILKNIKDGKYIASEDKAKADIEESLAYFEDRGYTEKSRVFLALAKIVRQIVDGVPNDKYFSKQRENLFLGKGLLMKADEGIQYGYQNRESSRYYYFLSLRYLSRTGDMKSFNHAFNMLYHSFFMSDNELEKAVLKKEFEDSLLIIPPEYQDSVIAVKELMTCSFDLDINYHRSMIGDNKIVRKIINSIFENEKLRESFTDSMSQLVNIPDNCKNADDFFKLWRKAKDKYNSVWSDIKKNISSAADNVTEPEKLNRCIDILKGLNKKYILSKTDNESFGKMIDILEDFKKINELVIIDDLIDTLDKVIDSCEIMEKAIQQSPTMLSYEAMLDSVTILKGKAYKQENKLYSESKPNLNVYAEDTVFYKEDNNHAKITIYVENKGNVQKANISNISLAGNNNSIEIIGNPEHTITTVHGNKTEEYIVDISFTEQEKNRKTFDIIFAFEYSYFDGNGDQIKSVFREIFPINLSSMDSFVKIQNKYSAFAEGGAVDTDDMFFGRENEIDNIVESLDQGDGKVLSHRGIYMYGQKRAGKSSIMAHLSRRINNRYPDKYIILDLGSIGEENDAKYEIWLKLMIVDMLQEKLELNYPEIYDEIISKDESYFDSAMDKIEKRPDTIIFESFLNKIERLISDKVIMIFIDEFTYIYESIKKEQCPDTFPHFWKALLQNHNICSIIIGNDSMVNFAEDYANDFACMKELFVSYLDEDEAKKLISDPIKDNGQNRFEDDALDLMYELTAGSAYLIMIICSQLVEYMNERGTSRVTKTTIETFLKKWLMNTAANSNPINDKIFEPQLYDPCIFEKSNQVSADNKAILTYIANNCNLNNQIKINEICCVEQLSDKTSEYQEKLIDQLIKRKVLIKEGEYCRIWVDLLRRYLKGKE